MKSPWVLAILIATLALGSCSSGGGPDDDEPNEPVSVNIGDADQAIEVGASYQFHYSVQNSSNTTVTWKVNDITGGNPTVGTISAGGLYTAPATIPSPNQVIVKAVANADTTKWDTATVTIVAASSLTISPMSVTVPGGATQPFTSSSGANWEVIGPSGTDAGTWGTIDASGLYEAPVTPPWTGQVTVKATSVTDPTKSASAAVTIVFSNAALHGRYVFRYRTVDSPSAGFAGRLWAVGSFEADGNGAITNGTADFVNFASTGNAALNAGFTGTYAIGADGRATAEFVLQMTGSPVLPMRWVLNSDVSARIVAFDDTGSGWGNIDRQDPSSFAANLDGTYVFAYDGLVSPHRPLSGAGMFDAAAGAISSGLMDINDNGALTTDASFSGTCSAIDPATGRGTWTATTGGGDRQFVFYAMGPAGFVFGSRSEDQGYLGMAIRQDKSSPYSNGSLSGSFVFASTGYVPVNPSEGIPAASVGRLTADGQGNLPAGTVDSIAGGTGATNAAASGTYTISPNGHGTMDLVVAGGTNSLSVYMFAPMQGFYVSLMSSVSSTGQFTPQASGGFNTASLRGNFALTSRGTFIDASNDLSGQMILDGAGALAGTADVNYAGNLAPATGLTGTYSISNSGRGDVALALGQATANYAIYAVSRRLVFLVPTGAGAPTEILYAYRQY